MQTRLLASGLVAIAAVVAISGCGPAAKPKSQPSKTAPTHSSVADLKDAYDVCLSQVSSQASVAEGQDYYDEFEFDGTDATPYLSLAGDGKSVEATTPTGGDLETSVAFEGAKCMLEQLKAPSGIASNMGSTSGQMGRQSDSWDQFRVSWSYTGVDPSQFDAVFEAR